MNWKVLINIRGLLAGIGSRGPEPRIKRQINPAGKGLPRLSRPPYLIRTLAMSALGSRSGTYNMHKRRKPVTVFHPHEILP